MMHSKNVFDATIGQDAMTRKCIKTYAFVFTRPKLHFSKKVAIQITTTLSRMGRNFGEKQRRKNEVFTILSPIRFPFRSSTINLFNILEKIKANN